MKDTFNTKYPDYVYRRRPNNSRKRRRTEGGVNRTLDNPLPSDTGDDISGSEILGEHSPIDDEHLTDSALDLQYPRIHQDPPTYGERGNFVVPLSKGLSYSYPGSDISHPEEPETRIPYLSSTHERVSQQTLSSARLAESHYPYIPARSNAQSVSQYTADPSTTQGNWESRVENARMLPPGWGGSQNRCLAVSSDPKSHSYSSATSPPPPPPWSSRSSAVSINPPNVVASQSSNYPFPTLNTPFYPSTSRTEADFSATSSLSLAHSGAVSNYPENRLPGSAVPSRQIPQYDNRSYASLSSSIRNANGYVPEVDRDNHQYQQPHARSALPRPLPPVQSISTFSHSHSHPLQAHSPSTTSNPAAQTGFWSRDNLDP